MKVLVTGGSGFIGTNLVDALRGRADVLSIDIMAPRKRDHRSLMRYADIRDRREIGRIVQEFRPDLVYHLAARTDLHGPDIQAYEANTLGVTNLIQALAALDDGCRVVYASSRLVFRIGHSPMHAFDYSATTAYGRSKIESERIVLEQADRVGNWIIVRPTSIWGPWFGVPYRDFFEAVRRGRYVRLKGHSVLKSFGFVGNAVHELVTLGDLLGESSVPEPLWLSDYQPLEVSDWADQIADAFGVRHPRTVPVRLLKAAARVGDTAQLLGWREPPVTSFRLANLYTPMEYDTSRTENLVGPLPYEMKDGVNKTVEWMEANA